MGQRSTIGNTELVEHGIQNDESQYRLHICFNGGVAYLFPTAAGAVAVEAGLGKPFEAGQPGVNFVTGKGRKVPAALIEDCREIEIPQAWLEKVDCKRTDSPVMKGQKAMAIAKWLFKTARVPVPVMTKEITDEQMQVRGTDLIVTSEWSVQVKCDYFGAENGLALQTHECNPFGLY
jgi:hypothetical protein